MHTYRLDCIVYKRSNVCIRKMSGVMSALFVLIYQTDRNQVKGTIGCVTFELCSVFTSFIQGYKIRVHPMEDRGP